MSPVNCTYYLCSHSGAHTLLQVPEQLLHQSVGKAQLESVLCNLHVVFTSCTVCNMWHRPNITSCVLRLIGGSSSAPLLSNRHEIHRSPVPPLFTWPLPTSTPGRWCWTPGCHEPISCAPLSLGEGGGTRL